MAVRVGDLMLFELFDLVSEYSHVRITHGKLHSKLVRLLPETYHEHFLEPPDQLRQRKGKQGAEDNMSARILSFLCPMALLFTSLHF